MSPIRLPLALLFVGLAATAAQAGEAAGRRVIGFAPDGRYFAFEQFHASREDANAAASVVVIDTRSDTVLPGTPLVATLADTLDWSAARATLAARARPLIERLRIGDGRTTRYEGAASAPLDAASADFKPPAALNRSIAFRTGDGRGARLDLETKAALRRSVCMSAADEERDVAAAGFRLTLAVDGVAPVTLHEDDRLPPGRLCATDYGLVEIYVHRNGDGAETIAALLEFLDEDNFASGPNRRFVAVVRPLPPGRPVTR